MIMKKMHIWQFGKISELPYLYGKKSVFMVIYESKDINTAQGNLVFFGRTEWIRKYQKMAI